MQKPDREPSLDSLFDQYEDIGGPELFGPEGTAILLAVWRKSKKLGWRASFQMTNTELQFQTGIKSRETINNHRAKLSAAELIDYIAPPRGQSRGDYTVKFSLPGIEKPVHKTDNFTGTTDELVQNMDYFPKESGDPVHKLDNLPDTVLIKTLIDRLIDGLDRVRFSDERCGVLTTVVASLSTRQIHLDDTAVSTRAAAIERYYMDRKQRLQPASADFTPVQQLAKMTIPLEYITFGIDLAFARHEKTKKWPGDTINQFSYCQKVIIGTWNRLLSDMAEASAAPQVVGNQPFTPPINRNQQRRNTATELRRQAKEDRERGQS